MVRRTTKAALTLAAVVSMVAALAGVAGANPKPKPSPSPPKASFQSLGQMPGSAMGTDVSGISGDGSTIAGYGWICTTFASNGSCWSAGDVQAFRWTPAGGYQTLGTPGTSAFFGSGAVSSDGSVIVGEHPPENGYAAFRWTAATGMVQLPINIASDHAFRWTAKTGMQDISKLVNVPQQLIAQSAIGVSRDGTVITGNGRNTQLGEDEPWRAVLPLP